METCSRARSMTVDSRRNLLLTSNPFMAMRKGSNRARDETKLRPAVVLLAPEVNLQELVEDTGLPDFMAKVSLADPLEMQLQDGDYVHRLLQQGLMSSKYGALRSALVAFSGESPKVFVVSDERAWENFDQMRAIRGMEDAAVWDLLCQRQCNIMQPLVLWADEWRTEVMDKPSYSVSGCLQVCMFCARHWGATGEPLKACNKCGIKIYCNVLCQRSDWSEHKGVCGSGGFANRGVVRPPQPEPEPPELAKSSHAAVGDPAAVAVLERLGMLPHASVLAENEIDMDALQLCQVSDLVELSLPIADSEAIVRELAMLQVSI